mgnify:CR=1 FL=1
MNLVLIVLIYSIIAFYEALPLIRERSIRELIAVAVIWLLGFVTSIFLALNVILPSPILLVNVFSHAVLNLLHLVF